MNKNHPFTGMLSEMEDTVKNEDKMWVSTNIRNLERI